MAKSNETFVETEAKIVSPRFVLSLVLIVAGIAWVLFYYLAVRPDPTVFPAPKASPKAIGSRISGGEACAIVEPSKNSTIEWTIDCG